MALRVGFGRDHPQPRRVGRGGEGVSLELVQVARQIESDPAWPEEARLGCVEARQEEHRDEAAQGQQPARTGERRQGVVKVFEHRGEDDDVVRRSRQSGVVEGGGLHVEPALGAGDLGAARRGLDAAHAPTVVAQRLEQLAAAAADVEQTAAAGPQLGEPAGDLAELAPPPGVFETPRGTAGAARGVIVVRVEAADLGGRGPRVEVHEPAAAAAHQREDGRRPWACRLRLALPRGFGSPGACGLRPPGTCGREPPLGRLQPIAGYAHRVGGVTPTQHAGDRLHRALAFVRLAVRANTTRSRASGRVAPALGGSRDACGRIPL